MSDYGVLTAQVRSTQGKGAARSLRRQGMAPGILYGAGKGNVSLSFSPLEFNKATDPARQWNTFFKVTLKEEGKADIVESCILSDVQLDACRSDLRHVDFLRVDPAKEVTRKVPVRFGGRSIGMTKGGKFKTFRRMVRVAAPPADLPAELYVDITPLDGGQSMRMKDVQLETGRLVEDPEARLCFVDMPKATVEEAEGDEKKEKADK